MRLSDLLCSLSKERRRTIAVAMANDPDIIGCVGRAMSMGLADFILIGERKKILSLASDTNSDIDGASFFEESDPARACDAAAELVREGAAQVLMKGLVSTATFTRSLLDKKHGFVPPGGLISHVGLFETPAYHKPLAFTDAGINIAPSLEEKVKILQNAISLLRSIGVSRPKAACIAPIEVVNPKIPSTVDADALARMGSEGVFGDAIVDGPLDLHIAVSREAARTKKRSSPVAGESDILLLSGLEAANVCYKCLSVFGSGRACSIVAGVSVPVVLTSRSDCEETRLLSIGLAANLGQGWNRS